MYIYVYVCIYTHTHILYINRIRIVCHIRANFLLFGRLYYFYKNVLISLDSPIESFFCKRGQSGLVAGEGGCIMFSLFYIFLRWDVL